ncbi:MULTISPECIES: transglutaminase domain-containing protein [Halobacterium]|uniref:transglutaminase domain-containing protein n=1 Tax=Halobacterium TaxID=2239 RepID=UPI00073EE50D|nr:MULTISPECIES: transglutaminase domain-containing protein [Halobacterium]MCG1003522.1 transglutaminase domain-containing protein [Halobacterium noricense]
MSDAPGPDARRALLAVVFAVGLVTAATAAPALAGQAPLGGLDSPPAPGDVPSLLRQIPGVDALLGEVSSQQGEFGFGSSAFGALTPGRSTSVGGPMSPGQRANATETHFLAEADESRYWRTEAYTTYTGSGWERQHVNRVQPPLPASELQTEWNEITLRRPATSVPTPWRPVNLTCGDGDCISTVSLTPTSGISAEPAFTEGQTYRVQSVEPLAAPSVLDNVRVAGSVVDAEYTTVETTDRVRERTSNVVGDADNRYDAAKRIERYLESNKTYSLTDVPEPGDHITDQFLFEQDAGYCEYFATAMTTMLRSQDVPARYVVGYAGGEYVGDGRYLVRGADAHAWVEVYFEDIGWVRFDPTPGDARESARDALHEDERDFAVSLNRTAVPGERVTASVTTAGLPARNVALVVNGERVGQTDQNGTVAFTVPYAEQLRVEVSTTVNLTTTSALAGVGEDRAYSVSSPAVAQQDDGNDSAQTFDVDSDVRFDFDGDVEPGAERTLTVTVGGRPFPDATVSVGGVEQGRTDDDGRIAVRIPEDASGVLDVTASRDDLTDTTTYPVDDLAIAVSPSLLAPLPGTAATARVTSGTEPVGGAAVTVAGERVGTTDADGSVSFEIPLARAPAVAAAASGKTTTTYIGWVLPSAVAALLAAVGALAGVVMGAKRRGVTPSAVAHALTALARGAVSSAVSALVGLAGRLDDLAAELRAAAADGWRGVLAWLASLPGRIRFPDVRGWLAGAAAAAGRASGSDADAGGERSVDANADAADGRLQAVWRRFVGVVGVERWETKTPGEVAREAVARGFPKRPVEALTAAFRDAAYGGRSESSRVDRAQEALDSVRDDREEGEQ